jgi:hypothetical protein
MARNMLEKPVRVNLFRNSGVELRERPTVVDDVHPREIDRIDVHIARESLPTCTDLDLHGHQSTLWRIPELLELARKRARWSARLAARSWRPPRLIANRRAIDSAVRWLPAGLIVAATVVLVWTRAIDISQSLWHDEINTLTLFADRGPAGIWSNATYIPGDHMLFMLLTWATATITGLHDEVTLRLWSVLPAIAGAVITTWWLSKRFDRWAAALFAVLAASTPVYLDLSIQARGYGLAILAGGLLLISADGLRWSRSRTWSWLFIASALIGIWTLPDFVLPFAGTCAVLAIARSVRTRLWKAMLIVGVASLVFYLPVLSSVLRSSGQPHGSLLPWHSVGSAPLKDVLAPLVLLLTPHSTLAEATMVCGLVLAASVVAMWWVPERFLVLLVLVPAGVTYLFADLTGTRYAPNFASFAIMPLLALSATGLVALGRLPSRLGLRGAPMKLLTAGLAALAVGVSVDLLRKIDRLGTAEADVPIENFKGAAALVQGTGIKHVLAGPAYAREWRWYLGREVTLLPLGALAKEFCSASGPLVYLEYLYGRSPRYANWADTRCLIQRGAVRIPVRQRLKAEPAVWVVPAASRPPLSQAAASAALIARASKPLTPPSTTVCGLSQVAGPVGKERTRGDTLTQYLGAGFGVSEQLLAARVVKSIRRETGGSPVRVAGAELAALTLRVRNIGHGSLRAIDAATGFFVRDAGGRSWQLSPICRGVSSIYAADTKIPLAPNSVLAHGKVGVTVALYPVPVGETRLYLETAAGRAVRLPISGR